MKKNKEKIVNNALVDWSQLIQKGVSEDELRRYFPRYVLKPAVFKCGWLKKASIWLMVWMLKVVIRAMLKPRPEGEVGDLSKSEVVKVYTREAKTYNKKHHLTTRGQDLFWRRVAAWMVTVVGRQSSGPIKIIDLCTGTGLTIKEMMPLLEEWNISAKIVGVDFCSAMLAVAEKIMTINDNVIFLQADITAGLTKELSNLGFAECDIITQVFGVGGISKISDVLDEFREILKVLKPAGYFFMADMHQPISSQPGEWPLLVKWFNFPLLEATIYQEVAIPLALKRLWGWSDSTIYFYLAPLVVIEKDSKLWSFKIQSFTVEPERWWLGLPIIPVGRILLEKVEITKEEANLKNKILQNCRFS